MLQFFKFGIIHGYRLNPAWGNRVQVMRANFPQIDHVFEETSQPPDRPESTKNFRWHDTAK